MILTILSLLMVVFSDTAYSQQRKPCGHLTNPTAKRNCLVRELNEANRQQRIADERLRRLNGQMKKACDAVQVIDQAARIAATRGVSPTNPISAGGATWTSVRTIMSALTKEKQNCESARLAVAEVRSQ